ncbi:hypothetical protein ABIA22_006537 [Sinorhizobium fredii]|nr:hypothetical protein AB395_00005554 [Sinorhizobium fredii CCBAU 45436]
MEGAFLQFGGGAAEVLINNVKTLVEYHDAVTREVRFNARLHAMGAGSPTSSFRIKPIISFCTNTGRLVSHW